jgi:hypothetical protein
MPKPVQPRLHVYLSYKWAFSKKKVTATLQKNAGYGVGTGAI